ncbi:BMP family ABC transporter substrate-binding protein [Mycoplasmopsis felis]|uniref:BMP family ABC transporter substrate-binding protein n=3 Tax=Mycoplasmopsis felis TaxID=33923 RepID=UPI002AFF18FD|nr:BMP family ABC transporter substrate-binding protein [Mycoplasmopsis felis]WQQ09324.1 BMP family ABC transporter substrate-binding protein [Mycoplasmopsis felis]
MKKQIKKLFLGTGLISIVPVFALAAQCGKEGTITRPSNYIPENQRVAEIVKDTTFTLPEEMVGTKLVVITDSGRVTDKSFNQSQWEALNVLQDQTTTKKTTKDGKTEDVFNLNISSIEPSGDYPSAYNAALSSGNKVWVLSGFTHGDHIKSYIKANASRLKNAGVKIINVDFVIDPEEVGYADVYNLTFKVNEVSYVAGYALAKFISENETENKKLSSFGGGPFNAVTDFITGYLKGIYDWNKENPDKKVTHTPVRLDSGFVPGEQLNNVINGLLAENPVSAYPVAGPATQSTITINNSKSNSKTKYIIGVDVDQSKSLGTESSGLFFTSVMKNLTQAVYDTILEVVFNSDKKPIFKGGSTKHIKKGDIAENWVKLAASTLTNEELRTKAQEAITTAQNKFNSLSAEDKAFLDEDKAEKGGQQYENLQDLINKLLEKVNS